MGFGQRAGAVALGLALDRLLPEPPNAWHPVAWFGQSMTMLERRIHADRRGPGVVYVGVGVGAGVALGRALPFTSLATTVVVAGRQLRQVASEVGQLAGDDQLGPARTEVRALVGRDPSQLDASGLAAAAIESLAENTVDSTFSAAFWALVAGAPGAYGFRAINTMDAMVGHRNERFENFGWAAARLDDVANWIPARLFGLAVAAHNPKRWQAILGGVRDDAPSHPSPNAGVAESAMAASLDVELGGPLRYPTPSGTREELRPRLGTGPRPTPSDVDDAVRVVDDLEKAVIALLVTVWAVSRWTSQR